MPISSLDNPTFNENDVNTTPQIIDADVTFTDAEGDFDGGTLIVTGLLAEDTVSVNNQGTGAGQIGLSGADVTWGGVIIGTLSGGAGATLTMTFNASATSEAIDALIQNLTYANSSETPTASRDLVLNITDAAGNDLGGPTAFTERTGAANPLNGVDVGMRGAPNFGDLDGDGDLDAVVGAYDGTLYYFENTGTASAPVFTPRTGAANPFNDIDGLYMGAPTVADLDDDGDLDAVVGAYDGTLYYFENTGTASAPVFTPRTGAANPLNDIAVGADSAPTFADLDGDGDLDAVVGDTYGTLHYFENTGTTSAPVFTARTGAANPFDGVDVGIISKPTVADLDGDGDLDIMVGAYDGTLFYFENTGTASAPVFTPRTGAANPFDGVDVGYLSNPALADLDGDGDLDSLVGYHDGVLSYFENTTAHAPSITVNVNAEADAPALTGVSTAVTFGENTVNATPQLLDADVVFTDSDGDFNNGTLRVTGLLAEDAVSVNDQGTGAGQIGLSGADVTYSGVVIGTLAGGSGSTLTITFNAAATSEAIDALIQNLTYANNSDTPTASRDLVLNITDAAGNDFSGPTAFTERTGAANPFDGVDVGYLSAPAFADLDGDGDLDAVVGDTYGTLHYFENTGTTLTPAFTERTGAANPFDGVDVGYRSAPAFADLDGDGDLDAMIGEEYGTLLYFENTGTALAPVFTERTGAANPFDGVDIGVVSHPAFADLDGDGDLDVVAGEFFGTLLYFENTGTDTAPVFTQRIGAANPFDGVDVGMICNPTFADLDSDGDLDAVVGEGIVDGTLLYFENTGDATAPVFIQRTGAANPFNDRVFTDVPALSTAFADLDGDGDLDTLIGEGYGALFYFENTTVGGQTITVNVNAEADAPALTGVSTAVTFGENTVNATPQLLDADVVFTDSDGDFNGGTLTVTGLLAEDAVKVNDQGPGAGQIGLFLANVTYGGVTIGIMQGGSGSTLTITFNASATSEAIDALIQNLTYANSSDTPTASRDLTINVTDAAGNNLGGPTAFTERTGAANPFNGVALGFYSPPTLADLDGDGDFDLVVGKSDGTLSYFENTGTASAPVFTERTGADNPFDGVDVGSHSSPAFADVDGDGDSDAVVGENDGTLNYFENTGTASAPVFTERTGAANPFDVDFGNRSAPAIADLDGDGDLDVLIGDRNGRLNYFENPATASGSVVGNPFSGVDVGYYSRPAFVDFDGDGDLDVLVGENDGVLNYFENTGTASVPVFTARTGAANPFDGVNVGNDSSPTFADLDGDGDLDALVGEFEGNLNYFENTTVHGQIITVNVTAEADSVAGTLTGLATSVTFLESVVNASAQLIDTAVVYGDVDDDLDGGTLVVSGLLAEDTVAVRNQGTGAGQIGVSSSNVTYGGVTIGTLSGGSGSTLTITFNASADSAAVDALIQNLTYANSSNSPTTSRDLTLQVTDEAGNGLDGGAQTITVNVTPEAESVTGGGGADTLVPTTGDDVINGGGGSDTANYGGASSGVTVNLATSGPQNTGGSGSDTLISIENVTGSDFADALYGNSGNNTLSGGGGNDVLNGGAGADTMSGGTGDDNYTIDNAGDVVVEAPGEGIDKINVSFSYTLGDNFEQLALRGSGAINGTGNALNNQLLGNGGANILDGKAGVDTLYGGGGNDTLIGGTGNDALYGDAGADVFVIQQASVGHSTLSQAGDSDRIFDLNFAQGDRIDLSDIDANANLSGSQAFTFVASFSNTAGQAVLSHNASTNRTTLTLDVDGDGRADYSLTLDGNHAGTGGNLYTGGGDTNGGWVL